MLPEFILGFVLQQKHLHLIKKGHSHEKDFEIITFNHRLGPNYCKVRQPLFNF
jgi:hypothetical protein